jgi:hypothetical protein
MQMPESPFVPWRIAEQLLVVDGPLDFELSGPRLRIALRLFLRGHLSPAHPV